VIKRNDVGPIFTELSLLGGLKLSGLVVVPLVYGQKPGLKDFIYYCKQGHAFILL